MFRPVGFKRFDYDGQVGVYWFKRRRFGYGWTPASPQGWALFTSYIAIVIAGAIIPGVIDTEPDYWVIGGYVGGFVILTVLMIFITIKKGPKPKWRWGTSSEDNPSEDL